MLSKVVRWEDSEGNLCNVGSYNYPQDLLQGSLTGPGCLHLIPGLGPWALLFRLLVLISQDSGVSSLFRESLKVLALSPACALSAPGNVASQGFFA